MNVFCLCVTSVLVITSVFSDQKTEANNIRVFPAANRTIAGVFQVSLLNSLNSPQYALNASEARRLCLSLGVQMASKEQLEKAVSKGFETCRFGWIDEHFAVVPRVHARINCGRNQTGLVPWRASVTQKFDVFCFNGSDAALQLKDATTDTPSSSSYHSTRAAQKPRTTSSSSFLPSSSPTPKVTFGEAEPAHYVGGSSVQRSSGGKLVLITCTSAFLVIAVVILAYLKLERRCSERSEEKNQQEYLETEDWTCAKRTTETENSEPQDESIEVEDEE